jgi:hypothetical protein
MQRRDEFIEPAPAFQFPVQGLMIDDVIAMRTAAARSQVGRTIDVADAER